MALESQLSDVENKHRKNGIKCLIFLNNDVSFIYIFTSIAEIR